MRLPAVVPPFFLLALALPVAGQQPGPPKVDETTLAYRFLEGRYRMPVTCKLEDGSLLELEEAVVIRAGPDRKGQSAVRATFFGIDAPGARSCFNLVNPELRDQRGVLYLNYRSLRRADLGVRDFRRELERGALEYRVLDGRLRLREIGGDEAEAVELDFDGAEARFLVSSIPRASDGDKLLEEFEARLPAATRRRLEIRIEGPEGLQLGGYYLEDEARRHGTR